MNNPILAKRDLKYGIFKRFLRRQKKNFNRLVGKIENNFRRDGWAVESARLESVCTVKGTVGSNPTLSATK